MAKGRTVTHSVLDAREGIRVIVRSRRAVAMFVGKKDTYGKIADIWALVASTVESRGMSEESVLGEVVDKIRARVNGVDRGHKASNSQSR